ncbi:MAG: hydroxymethylglutaryl-CoA lyase [Roseovarius sp.]|nr:hydroxymethylglutaryl-CoA lyase [Roseovarius sp.]MCY4314743.1 hydroxymethylglutaryl-CoA lyase [Roseovarius sp.]
MSRCVEIYEVGPRDGLQNEKRRIPVEDKVALIDHLGRAGFRHIEVASFVSPKWIPQMADSGEVMKRIARVEGVAYAALTPNMRGLESAISAQADEVAVFGSASEGFSKANINSSVDESLKRFSPVVAAAVDAGMSVRGYVSCVVNCPYEGPVEPKQVARIAERLYQMGCREISLGDTTGRALPENIAKMLDAVAERVPVDQLAGHYHDTTGRALENVEVSLEKGVRVFDAAAGGLGGCPYAPGASGNVATEAVHDRLTALGYETGLNRDVIAKAALMARAMRA